MSIYWLGDSFVTSVRYYAEAGRKDEARGALNEYLRSTAMYADKNMAGYRNQAMKVLETLR